MQYAENQALLKALQGRKSISEFGYGIQTADRYLESLQNCVGSDLCYRYCANGTCSFDDQVKRAKSTLTYSNPDMTIEDVYLDWKKEFTQTDSFGQELELPKNTLQVLKHCLTSPRKDRDGDILRTQGARPDPKMLMLFQHQHALPVGKMLGVAEHNSKKLSLISAIIDINPLSHDVAVMNEAKMGRFSHGFRALKFTEVKENTENGVTSSGGFDIDLFEIMEASWVSVPSNVDAVQEEILYSMVAGGKLTSPLMKGYGATIKSRRNLTLAVPSQFGQWDKSETKDADTTGTEKSTGSASTKTGTTPCGCGGHGAGSTGTSAKADDAAEGQKPEEGSDVEMICPKCKASMVGGKCTKCGYTESAEKSVDSEKSGRVINASNLKQLTQARDNMKNVHDGEILLTPGGKALCREAHNLVEKVIGSAAIEDSPNTEREVEVTAKEAMGIFITKADTAERTSMMKYLRSLETAEHRNAIGEQLRTLVASETP